VRLFWYGRGGYAGAEIVLKLVCFGLGKFDVLFGILHGQLGADMGNTG
jgi:hypothetical protein